MDQITPNISTDKEGTSFFLKLRNFVLNILSVLGLLGIVGVLGVVVLIYQSPYHEVNPYPPPTLSAILVLPTSAETPIFPQPTSNPTSQIKTKSNEAAKTQTPRISVATPVRTVSELMLTPSATLKSGAGYQFAQQGSTAALNASVFYPDRGCEWMGVGGQVLDIQDRPYIGIQVVLGGYLDSKPVNIISLTGSVQTYGDASYEFELAKTLIASQETLWLRLVDQSNLPISDRIYFDTYNDCKRNLILINFKQIR